MGGTGPAIVSVIEGRGYEVIGIDLHPRTQAFPANYVCHDLREAAGLSDLFFGADGVIHFGSPPGDSWMSTTEGFHQLAVAGFNVFQAARNAGVRRIAWASSIMVYGLHYLRPPLPITEESAVAPAGIYGCSKLLLERLAIDYCRWHGMSIAGFRLSRIIYDNDFGRAKLKRFVEDEGLGGDCLWSYVDARDVATACLSWLESDRQGAEVFNLAAANVHQETPTAELLKKYGYEKAETPALVSSHHTPFSTEKIRAMLGWKDKYDWREILTP
jgi:nucleoside-diphosphate-sugar epimerase